MAQENNNKKDMYNSFLMFTFGLLIVAFGGITGILDTGASFWFPLGLFSFPWLSKLITLISYKEENKK